MEKTLLKKAAIQSVILMIAVITISLSLQQYQTVAISASDLGKDQVESMSFDQAGVAVLSQGSIPLSKTRVTAATGGALAAALTELTSQVDGSILKKLGNKYLVIKKPKAEKLNVRLEDLYIDHSVRLDLSGLLNKSMDSDMIFRIQDNDLYQGDPKYKEIEPLESTVIRDYGSDFCHNITIESSCNQSTGLYEVQVLLELDCVYDYNIYEDDNNYYISLKKPSEVYDKILVIDAGHGGKDAGALSKDKKCYEKNMNLAILLQLKELLDKENIKVYYTRTDDTKVFLRPRVTLANAVDCDYFISIHCNANEVTSPNGTEILYYDKTTKGVPDESLAKLFSEELSKTVQLQCRGIVKKQGDEIFIMDKSQVPTVLIEVGYMSNKKDLSYLCNPENIKAVAQGIYNGIMRAYQELPVFRE